MKCVNLIPASMRDAQRRRRHAKRWLAVWSAYGLLLLAACAVCHAVSGGDHHAVSDEIARTSAKVNNARTVVAALGKELADAQLKLEGNLTVGGQPDWGVLLAVIAKSLREDVLLHDCRLLPTVGTQSGTGDAQAGQQASAAQESFAVEIAGFGRSHAAVARFVMRLRKTTLFDKIRLTQTSLQMLKNRKAVAFELECTLGPEKKDLR